MRELINHFKHENSEYEKEVKILFNELNEQLDELEKKWDRENKDFLRGLDGGTAQKSKELTDDYFRKLDMIRKKYKIDTK